MTEASLRHWHEVAGAAAWQSPLNVVADFSKAKALNGERVRFEVAGGDDRMVVAFDWRRAIAFIKIVGTHAEYDKIDALTVNLF
jgi:mRNA interferase HigB